MVFCEELPEIEDKRSLQNILDLRRHLGYMRQLNEHSMLAVNKFGKKLLKNSYILGLFRKHSQEGPDAESV